jgi:hypothetical protein
MQRSQVQGGVLDRYEHANNGQVGFDEEARRGEKMMAGTR